jgi:hypothetical protein
MRNIIDLSCKVRENHFFVRLSGKAKMDMKWWLKGLKLFNGKCHFVCDVPYPSYCFATDACETGGGGFLGEDWFYTNWELDSPELCGHHINELELATVVVALHGWGSMMSHTHVRIRSDNMATVSALNKSTSRSPALMPLIHEIYWLSVLHDLTLSCVHIPGVSNVLADRLSRLDSVVEAHDARAMLAGFTGRTIFCKEHMSSESFVYLQARRDAL